MRSITRTVLLVLGSTASLSLRGAAAQEPATPASTASSPAPQETSSASSGNLLTNIYKLAKGLGLTRCVPYALPLVTTLPRLPAGLVNNDLIGQALSQTTLSLSDVCDFSVTGSVGDIYTNFLPAWYSWHNAHLATISGILKKCPSATALVSTIEAYESCSQVEAVIATATVTGSEATATETEASTAAASSDGTGTATPETTTSASDAASLKDTCLVIAPAAAVGLLVAAL